MAAVVIVIVFLLLLFIVPTSNTQNEDAYNPPEPPMGNTPSSTWEKNHFINKHLHRDDKKHDRHRRNQFPQ